MRFDTSEDFKYMQNTRLVFFGQRIDYRPAQGSFGDYPRMLVDSDLNDNVQHVFTSLRDSAFEIAKTDMYRGERYPFALFRCDSCSFHICVF